MFQMKSCLTLILILSIWTHPLTGFTVESNDTSADGLGSARQFPGYCSTETSSELPPFCEKMVPQNGKYPPQPTNSSPWKIYTFKPEIQQFFSHPVVLGSDTGEEIFNNFMVTARALSENGEPQQAIGHFEFQWDAVPVCCFPMGMNYSYEGEHLRPNMLVGASADRVRTPNQTLLWTAPKYFEGPVVFIATLWKSSKRYWPNVRSEPVQVIKRAHKPYVFRG